MTDNDRRIDPEQMLADHAQHLNAICWPAWWPDVFYEVMSGGLVWSDETNGKTPTEVIWALRSLFAYRTSLMLDEPREELKPMWDLGRSLFPRWVGFRLNRRQPTPELLRIYRRGDVSLRYCLRGIEREMDREDAQTDAAANCVRDPGS